MIKKILIGLAVIVVAFVIIVALQPSEFRIVRAAIIAAPAPAVFAQVNERWRLELPTNGRSLLPVRSPSGGFSSGGWPNWVRIDNAVDFGHHRTTM